MKLRLRRLTRDETRSRSIYSPLLVPGGACVLEFYGEVPKRITKTDAVGNILEWEDGPTVSAWQPVEIVTPA